MYFSLVFLGWVCCSLKAADFWIEIEIENRNKKFVSYLSPSPIHFIMMQGLLWNILTLDNRILDTGSPQAHILYVFPVVSWAGFHKDHHCHKGPSPAESCQGRFCLPWTQLGVERPLVTNLPVPIGAHGHQPLHVEWSHAASKVWETGFCLGCSGHDEDI